MSKRIQIAVAAVLFSFFFISCASLNTNTTSSGKITKSFEFSIKNSSPYHKVTLTVKACYWSQFNKYYNLLKESSINVKELDDVVDNASVAGEMAEGVLKSEHFVYYYLECANNMMFYVRKSRSRDGPQVIAENQFTSPGDVWSAFYRKDGHKYYDEHKKKTYLGFLR